jgi:hypothetical protein
MCLPEIFFARTTVVFLQDTIAPQQAALLTHQTVAGRIYFKKSKPQQSDCPFTVSSSVASTSSLDSEITFRKSHSRVLSEDSEVEIVHYSRKQCSIQSHIQGAETSNLQTPSRNLLGPKEVLVTETGPDTYHTNHSVYGE